METFISIFVGGAVIALIVILLKVRLQQPPGEIGFIDVFRGTNLLSGTIHADRANHWEGIESRGGRLTLTRAR